MKRLLYFFLLILSCETVLAQKLDQDWNKLVDYVSCKYVEAYIESERDNQNEKQNIASYDKNIRNELIKITLDSVLSFDELSNLLKNNGWSSTKTNLLEIINKKKNDTVEKTIENLVATDGLTDKFTKILETKRIQLKKELGNIYTITKPTPLKTPPLPQQSVTVKEQNRESTWLLILVMVNVLLLLLLVLFILYRTSAERIKLLIEKSVRLEKKFVLKTEAFNTNNGATQQNTREQINKLENELKRMQQEIDKLQNQTTTQQLSSNNTNIKQNTQLLPQEQENILYLKTAKEGLFNSTFSVPNGCYFKMFDIIGNRAKFEFCGNAEEAIANRDAIFDNVCETVGISQNAHIIKNEISGSLLLQDGKWKVINKAKIRFE